MYHDFNGNTACGLRLSKYMCALVYYFSTRRRWRCCHTTCYAATAFGQVVLDNHSRERRALLRAIFLGKMTYNVEAQ